ncbi:MAG: septum formation initiator family protein [Pseudomonadota bacterium]
MRVVLTVLLLVLAALQFRLWREVSEVRGLRDMVEQQLEENESLRARNEALAAEVEDLREGLEAIEERARAELGLIQEGEDFFLVVDPAQAEPDPDS